MSCVHKLLPSNGFTASAPSKRTEIDVVEGTHIDRDRLGIVATARAERTNSACAAEQVMDDLFVELIVRLVVLAREQGELRPRHEREQIAALLAERAVARHGFMNVGFDLVADTTAMAATGLLIGHFLAILAAPEL
jgi:hypothetical protein